MSRQVSHLKIASIDDERLLLSRKDVCALLGISYHQVILLEEAGTLRAVRLSPGPKAKAYFRRADVIALTECYAPCHSHELKSKVAKKTKPEARP
jgi:hypothetical protein